MTVARDESSEPASDADSIGIVGRDALHPWVADWFCAEVGQPSPPQRVAWPTIARGEHLLLAAPTGTGKTFAGFLIAIDRLFRQALDGPLPDRLLTLYVSPLRALTHDIARNLDPPLCAINAELERRGLPARLRAAARTGDTLPKERRQHLKSPPHILVTTPESLYLMLGSEGGRTLLGGVRTLILDEIHAVSPDKRGAHLALSVERLEALVARRGGAPLQRIGLSATQRPLSVLARYLGGRDAAGQPRPVTVHDQGHLRPIDVRVDVPAPDELAAVASLEQWDAFLDHIAELVGAHRTTLVFVNTRRLAERTAHRLAERLGAEAVGAHHGSLSRERRFEVEARFKAGDLAVLVATASMELGLDVGTVDLVVQIGTTRSVATLLQRVGRAGHSIDRTPKGRIIPTTRNELVEAATLVRAIRRGELDPVRLRRFPLDVLAQQLVAGVAEREGAVPLEELWGLVRSAALFHELPRADFDAVIAMLCEGFETPMGRVARWLRRDPQEPAVHARRGARLTALLSGTAIPELGEYRVLLEPDDRTVGTVHEDWAIESLPGDVFLLGNESYQVRRIERGAVRVRAVPGMLPNVPFWRGEAPGRTPELSAMVGAFREDLVLLAKAEGPPAALASATEECGLPAAGGQQVLDYLLAQDRATGWIPTRERWVAERFFDDSGGMQLCIHAPLGVAVNRALALLLRKRFCRSFNQELQAAATDDGLVISLTDAQVLRLEHLPGFLRSKGIDDDLEQAVLGAPFFATRWRWNAMAALAVPRRSGGKSLPFDLLRMRSDDLLAACFPDQAACQEHLAGPVEIPSHPLIDQTLRDCLEEATDLRGLEQLLQELAAGRVTVEGVDTTAPSPFAEELIGARPWAFLDDAPLEERRARAVARGPRPREIEGPLDALDARAVAEVQASIRPLPRHADGLEEFFEDVGLLPLDVLADYGPELESAWQNWGRQLLSEARVCRHEHGGRVWIWAVANPAPDWGPEGRLRLSAEQIDAALRGRARLALPWTIRRLVRELAIDALDAEAALRRGEAAGRWIVATVVPDLVDEQWIERSLLARIHRLTRDHARGKVAAVTPRIWMRWLLRWQAVHPEHRWRGPDAFAGTLDRLALFEAPAAEWESSIFAQRSVEWRGAWLDQALGEGHFAWGRPAWHSGKAMGRATLLAFWPRSWNEDVLAGRGASAAERPELRGGAAQLLDVLQTGGALFHADALARSRLLPAEFDDACRELIAAGWLTSDGFGLARRVLQLSSRRRPTAPRTALRRGRQAAAPRDAMIGRMDLLRPREEDSAAESATLRQETAGRYALRLLQRHGILFRDLFARQDHPHSWRELRRALALMELRGEIRGGRFVAGFDGEQFAIDAAARGLNAEAGRDEEAPMVEVAACDPLNLSGLLPGTDRVAAVSGHRLELRDGWPSEIITPPVRRP